MKGRSDLEAISALRGDFSALTDSSRFQTLIPDAGICSFQVVKIDQLNVL